MLSTVMIEQLLSESHNLDEFFEKYSDFLTTQPFYEYALSHISKKNIKLGEVIEKSCLSRSMVYKMLSGERQATRDTIIQLAFGIGLNVEETNRMLKLASHAPLAVRNKREAIIIFSLNHHYNLVDADALIESHKCETLITY